MMENPFESKHPALSDLSDEEKQNILSRDLSDGSDLFEDPSLVEIILDESGFIEASESEQPPVMGKLLTSFERRRAEELAWGKKSTRKK